jgi:hypothetical protein
MRSRKASRPSKKPTKGSPKSSPKKVAAPLRRSSALTSARDVAPLVERIVAIL